MKKLIANSWKKCLVVIGIVLIGFNIFSKIVTKKNIIPDYIRYGKTYTKPSFVDHLPGASGIEVSGVSGQMIKVIFIFMIAILAVVFISSLGNKSADKAKKK